MCLSIKVRRPDAVLCEGTYRGMEWVVTHNGIGYRCGYVRIPPGHPWHGKNENDIDASCHGGLTFAEPDLECGKGSPEDAWWIGFDCAHYNDAQDPSLPHPHRMPDLGVIRDTPYVIDHCKDLIDQALNLTP